jgi:hypothetical protein
MYIWEALNYIHLTMSESAEALRTVATHILGAGAALSFAEVKLSGPGELDLAGETGSPLWALLVAPQKLKISCAGLDVGAVLSRWAGMLEAGVPRGWRELEVQAGAADLSLSSDGTATVSLRDAAGFEHLGDLVTDLTSSFRVQSVNVTFVISKTVQVSWESPTLKNLGRAVSRLESFRINIPDGYPSSALLSHLVELIVIDRSLFAMKHLSIRTSPSTYFGWDQLAGSLSITMLPVETACRKQLLDVLAKQPSPQASLTAVFARPDTENYDLSSFVSALREFGSVSVTFWSGVTGSDLQRIIEPLCEDEGGCFLSKEQMTFMSGQMKRLFRWERDARSLYATLLPPSTMDKVAGLLSRSSVALNSMCLASVNPDDLEVGSQLLRVMCCVPSIKVECCDILAVLSGLKETARSAVDSRLVDATLELSGPSHNSVVRRGAHAKVCVRDVSSLAAFPDVCAILCDSFGVYDLWIECKAGRDLAPHAAFLSTLPITTLTVEGFRPDWAVEVVRPGLGPLRTLRFAQAIASAEAINLFSRLLGPNESLVTVLVAGADLDVDPRNFRLVRGSKLSDRNRKMRRALASLLSALPDLNTQDIPSEIGFAIRRTQARITPVE